MRPNNAFGVTALSPIPLSRNLFLYFAAGILLAESSVSHPYCETPIHPSDEEKLEWQIQTERR
jgi:hypothetical protein